MAARIPRRRWMQFSLRTLLFVLVPLAAILAKLGNEYHQGNREVAAIHWAEAQGAGVYFNNEGGEPLWQRKIFGEWYPSRVEAIDFSRSLDASNVRELAPLSVLVDLKWLDLSGTQVDDLAPISRLPHLELLIIEATPDQDLAPLKRLGNLRTLQISVDREADLTPLAQLKNLERLKINSRDGPLPEEQLRRLQESLPRCVID